MKSESAHKNLLLVNHHRCRPHSSAERKIRSFDLEAWEFAAEHVDEYRIGAEAAIDKEFAYLCSV